MAASLGMRGVFFARTTTSDSELAEAAQRARVVPAWTDDPVREAGWDGYCAINLYLLPAMAAGFEYIDGDLAKGGEMLRAAVVQAALHGRHRGGEELLAQYIALPSEPDSATLEQLAATMAGLAGVRLQDEPQTSD